MDVGGEAALGYPNMIGLYILGQQAGTPARCYSGNNRLLKRLSARTTCSSTFHGSDFDSRINCALRLLHKLYIEE